MSQNRLPPPDPEACLVRLRPSTQKGGTIIAEDVTERTTHERRLCDPDGYRPSFCPTCGERRLHVHDYRARVLRAESETPVATIVRHTCVACAAIWQVLPAFIARHLWRTWPVVAHTLTPDGPPAPGAVRRGPTVPARTARRWRARWQRSAQTLAQILTASGAATWAALAGRLPAAATCGGSDRRLCPPARIAGQPRGRGRRRAHLPPAAEGPSHVTPGSPRAVWDGAAEGDDPPRNGRRPRI